MDPNAYMMQGSMLQGQISQGQMYPNQMVQGQLPQGQMPQGQISAGFMQRQQPTNLPSNQQMALRIADMLSKNPPMQGWQATLDNRERASAVVTMVNNLRQLNQDLMECINIAIRYEQQTLMNSPNKEMWKNGLRKKLQEVVQAVQNKNQQEQQQQLHQQQQQQGLLPQTPMQHSQSHQGQPPNGFTPQMANPTPSQIRATPMGMPGQFNQMMPQNQQPMMLTPQPQQQQQPQQMQQQVQNQPQQAQKGQAQQPQRPGGAPSLTPEEQQMVRHMAGQIIAAIPEPQKQAMRQTLLSKMTPQQRQQHQQQGIDPLVRHHHSLAARRVLQQRTAAHQGQVSNQQVNNVQNMQQRMNQQQSQQAQQQQQQGQPGQSSADIDFSAFLGQQADAMKMQGAGELVVPASNNPAAAGQMQSTNMSQMNVGAINVPPGMTPLQIQQAMAQRNANMRGMPTMNGQVQPQMQQNMQAQQLQQMQQLRGQSGGLNMSQQGSPAMSMLNRPIVPPGQQNNPQNVQGAGQSQPPSNQINMNQMGQAQSQFNGQIQYPADMPANIIQNLSTGALNEAQIRSKITTWNEQRPQRLAQQQRAAAAAQQPAAVNQGGMQNGNNNGMPNMQGNAQAMAQGMQGGPRNNVDPAKVRAHDATKLPPKLVTTLKLPNEVQTWGQAKQWIAQNHERQPAGMLQKLTGMQQMLIAREEAAQGNRQTQQQMSQTQNVNSNAPSNMNMPLVNQGQQMPQMQGSQPGIQSIGGIDNSMQNFPIPEVTPQEIEMVRSRVPNGHTMPESSIRQLAVQLKMANTQNRNAAALAQQQKNMQMANQMSANDSGAQQRRAMLGQVGGPQPGQVQLPPQQTMQMNQAQAFPGAQTNPMADRQPQRPNGPAQMPKEQFNQLTLDQKRQFEQQAQMQNAQMAAQMQNAAPGNTEVVQTLEQIKENTPALQRRLQVLMREADATVKKGMPLNLNEQTIQESMRKLKELVLLMSKFEQQMVYALAYFGEEAMRKVLRIRTALYQNMTKKEIVNEFISLSPLEIQRMEIHLKKFLSGVRMKYQMAMQQAQHAVKTQEQRQTSAPQSSPPQPQPPSMQRQPTQVGRNASQSRKSKTPAAPTTEQPPFALGASPQGVPVYDGKSHLTPDKLQLPTTKKRKTNAASTPVASASSPAIPQAKTVSPEQKRPTLAKTETTPRIPEQQRYKCGDAWCEFALRGFATELELRRHIDEVHRKTQGGDPLEKLLGGLEENAKQAQQKEKEALLTAKKDKERQSKSLAAAAKASSASPVVKKEVRKELGKDIATPVGVVVTTPVSPIKGKKLATPSKRDVTSAGAAVPGEVKTEQSFLGFMEEKYGVAPTEAVKPSGVTVAPAAKPISNDADTDFLALFGVALDDVDALGMNEIDLPAMTGDGEMNWHFDITPTTPRLESVPTLTPDGSTSSAGEVGKGEVAKEMQLGAGMGEGLWADLGIEPADFGVPVDEGGWDAWLDGSVAGAGEAETDGSQKRRRDGDWSWDDITNAIGEEGGLGMDQGWTAPVQVRV